MLNANPNLKYVLANKKENITDIYKQLIIKYKELARDVIKEIIILSKDNFKKPFNLYNYYINTGFDFRKLASFALSFKNIKGRKLILQYFERFQDIFYNADDRYINSLKQRYIISCANESIGFTNNDLTKALEDIKDKDLPTQKSVLYYAIKRQIELRDVRVKKKELN